MAMAVMMGSGDSGGVGGSGGLGGDGESNGGGNDGGSGGGVSSRLIYIASAPD